MWLLCEIVSEDGLFEAPPLPLDTWPADVAVLLTPAAGPATDAAAFAAMVAAHAPTPLLALPVAAALWDAAYAALGLAYPLPRRWDVVFPAAGNISEVGAVALAPRAGDAVRGVSVYASWLWHGGVAPAQVLDARRRLRVAVAYPATPASALTVHTVVFSKSFFLLP